MLGQQKNLHKYVNHEYGFSLWYSDTYTSVPPADADEGCQNGEYDKCLLLLERRDNPMARLWVRISVRPFQLCPGAGDIMPSRRRIGRHVFYSGMGASMGVGFTDFYDLNLKGKTLMFVFGPDDEVNPHEETKQIEPKVLKTFRTF
jgi:hypothetical protein